MKYTGIIPARYASTRFPGKPLVDIMGKPMIRRVYEQVSGVLDDVCVATDDSRIFDCVTSFGGNVIMTSESHQSGTDRCREAFERMGNHADIVINIQGDEPFIQPSQIELLKLCFDDTDTDIATLVREFDKNKSFEELANPNSPKVVLNKNMQAMYFSRSIIPYIRNTDPAGWAQNFTFYLHVGLYAYRANVLKEITLLPMSALEKAESLEQLRWLENGYKIKAAITSEETIGIDTPEDLKKLKF